MIRPGPRGSARFLLTAAFLFASAAFEPALRGEDLNVEGQITSVLARDCDGDGLAELWVSSHEGRQRLLGLFQGKKPYSGQPDRSITVDPQAILYTLGDFDGSPGLDLVLLSRTSGVLVPFAPSAGAAQAPGPRKLFDADLFFAEPSRTVFPPWLSRAHLDINGDGREDLAVPERNRLRLLFGSSGDFGGESAVVPAGYHSLFDSREARASKVIEDFAEEDKSPSPLYDGAASSPYPLFQDFNGDGRLDVIVKQPGQRLEVYLQSGSRAFPQAPDVQVELEWARKATALELPDLNGDRRLDLVGVQLLLKDLATEVRICIQDPSRPDSGFVEPKQILRVQGFFRRPALADLDGDGRIDLAVSPYRVDMLESLKKSVVEEIEITHEVFLGGGDTPFERRPSYQEKLLLRTQDLESSRVTQPIVAGRDITGDGRPDLLFLGGGQLLRLFRAVEARPLRYEEDSAFRQKVEDPQRVQVLPLDREPGDEILLFYKRRLEVLRRK